MAATISRICNGLLLLILCALSACITSKSYIDPALPQASYANLPANEHPKPVQLLLEFQTNGVLNASETGWLRPRVVVMLLRSKQFSDVQVSPQIAKRQLFITINNFGDLDKAGPVETGLTLGALGTMVTDRYAMEARFQAPGTNTITKIYTHAVYSTIGNAPGPPGLQAHPGDEAFSIAIEQLVLNMLTDLAKEGVL